MPINVDDILRLTAEMNLFGTDEVANVYNLKVTARVAVDDDAFMVSMALALDVVYTLINAEVSTSLNYVQISGINVTQDELLPSKPWPLLVAGLDAGVLLPTQAAASVFFRTIAPKVRASKFLAGYTHACNAVNGVISAGCLANLQLFGNAVVNGLNSGGNNTLYGAYNPLLARFTPTTTAVVPTRWRTQRRRRIGVGS